MLYGDISPYFIKIRKTFTLGLDAYTFNRFSRLIWFKLGLRVKVFLILMKYGDISPYNIITRGWMPTLLAVLDI